MSAIGVMLLFFVLNPKWIPLVSSETKEELQMIINNYGGQFQAIISRVLESADRIIAVALVFVVVYIIRTINALIFSMINFENRRKETLKVLLESLISYGAAII